MSYTSLLCETHKHIRDELFLRLLKSPERTIKIDETPLIVAFIEPNCYSFTHVFLAPADVYYDNGSVDVTDVDWGEHNTSTDSSDLAIYGKYQDGEEPEHIFCLDTQLLVGLHDSPDTHGVLSDDVYLFYASVLDQSAI